MRGTESSSRGRFAAGTGSWPRSLGRSSTPWGRMRLRSFYLCTDATGVLAPSEEKCRTGHFWVLVAPGLHVLFGYSPGHDRAGVDKLLMGHQGYLVADAHVVYDHLFTDSQRPRASGHVP